MWHLPAGKLYIAKVTQEGAPGAVGKAATTSFTIQWILLGSANQVGRECTWRCGHAPQLHML
jgi:hypothetical protein